jgi:hypothetical protein
MMAIWTHILGFRHRFLTAALLAGSLLAHAQPQETAKAMAEVVKIAHAIAIVQPKLEEPKYIEYALGIYRASKKYGIRPGLIIAIAHQESSFQERLPEGKAGELGITQVLKRWVNNPKFRKEFPHATEKSFTKPAESFLYTSWILKELKESESPGTLPFWSFYNARQFKHRIKYFVRVNKHMAKLKRNLYRIEEALSPEVVATRRPEPPSDRTLAFASKIPTEKPWVAKPYKGTKAAAAPKPVTTYPWLAELPPKTKPSKPDPREALLRSASLGG